MPVWPAIPLLRTAITLFIHPPGGPGLSRCSAWPPGFSLHDCSPLPRSMTRPRILSGAGFAGDRAHAMITARTATGFAFSSGSAAGRLPSRGLPAGSAAGWFPSGRFAAGAAARRFPSGRFAAGAAARRTRTVPPMIRAPMPPAPMIHYPTVIDARGSPRIPSPHVIPITNPPISRHFSIPGRNPAIITPSAVMEV